jgi:hypothetical protein
VLAPFKPRRTAATISRDLGLSNKQYGCVLTATKGEDDQPLLAVTNNAYNLAVVGRVERGI